jgi:hypothetical protein
MIISDKNRYHSMPTELHGRKPTFYNTSSAKEVKRKTESFGDEVLG